MNLVHFRTQQVHPRPGGTLQIAAGCPLLRRDRGHIQFTAEEAFRDAIPLAGGVAPEHASRAEGPGAQSERIRQEAEGYCTPTLESGCTFVTGGGFHLPMSASDFGAYIRISKLNGSLGAGSQLASLSF